MGRLAQTLDFTNSTLAAISTARLTPEEKPMIRTSALILAFSLTAAMNASAVTLNFNSLTLPSDNFSERIGNIYTNQGFEIVGTPPSYWPSAGLYVFGQANTLWTGSPGLTYYGVGAPIKLEEISGKLFTLTSIDLARGDLNSGLIPVGFSGLKADGSTVSAVYRFTNTLKGHLETFTFGAEFTNLKSVAWHQGAEWHQFDNVNVSTIPEPNTFILFGLALAILALRLRKCSET